MYIHACMYITSVVQLYATEVKKNTNVTNQAITKLSF